MSEHQPEKLVKPTIRSVDEAKHEKLHSRISARIKAREEANRRDRAILEGSARDLERIETPEEQSARLYKARIREALREAREQLTGSRSKGAGSQSVESRLFECLYKLWRKQSSPSVAVPESLLIKFGSRATVHRKLDSLRQGGLINWKTRRGKGRGKGRGVRRYTLPLIPTWEQFKVEFEARYRHG